MKFKTLISILMIHVAGCTLAPAYGMSLFRDKPGEEVTPNPTPVPSPTPKPAATPAPSTATAKALRADLEQLALSSACKSAVHGNVYQGEKIIYPSQGIPPQGYIRGIALTAARAACKPEQEWVKVASQPLGTATADALTHYGLPATTSEERFDWTMSLIVGSAAREASWRWCVGRDVRAKPSDVKACLYGGGETCEAGNYQSSYNSIGSKTVLKNLFAKYKASSDGCFAEVYKGKTTCSEANLKNHGSNPEALKFQSLQKNCPGYATEHHAVMLRLVRTHYGPVNKKGSLAHASCKTMFSKVRDFVKANPAVCSVL